MSSKTIIELVIIAENEFQSGKMTAREFLDKLDTYSYGQGLSKLPRSWTSKIWKERRLIILEKNSNSNGDCNCKKCKTTIKESPIIQHHSHPRKFKEIMKEMEKKAFKETALELYEESKHKHFYNLNLCPVCNRNMKFVKHLKKFKCDRCPKLNPRSGKTFYRERLYDYSIEKKELWSLSKFTKRFYSYISKKSEQKALEWACNLFIQESQDYRNLSKKFPWSIYCRECAYREDLKKGKIKKRKIELVDNENNFEKPKIRIRRTNEKNNII